jgi:hypothetical protein
MMNLGNQPNGVGNFGRYTEHGLSVKWLMSKGRFAGGCSRTRTCDPLIKSQLLYQLSYTPIPPRRRRGPFGSRWPTM